MLAVGKYIEQRTKRRRELNKTMDMFKGILPEDLQKGLYIFVRALRERDEMDRYEDSYRAALNGVDEFGNPKGWQPPALSIEDIYGIKE